MNITFQTRSGLTLPELLLVIVILAVLIVSIIPATSSRTMRAPRITCVNNLKQVGLSMRLWAEDNDGKFPNQVSTNDGGLMEIADSAKAFRHFQLLSNELGTPKILVCPTDEKRGAATNFKSLANKNVSFFFGVDAIQTNANMLIAGDRNITNGFPPIRSLITLRTNQMVEFTKEMHKRQGNVGLSDSSVYQVSSARLRSEIIPNTGIETNRIKLP